MTPKIKFERVFDFCFGCEIAYRKMKDFLKPVKWLTFIDCVANKGFSLSKKTQHKVLTYIDCRVASVSFFNVKEVLSQNLFFNIKQISSALTFHFREMTALTKSDSCLVLSSRNNE